jgi:serine/threonine-protein kinase RsbT
VTQGRAVPLRLNIRTQADVVMARRRGMEMALALGFSQVDATQIATVISELARNIVLYAGAGALTLFPIAGSRGGLQVVARDGGPGIPNVALALEGGHSTSKGLGLGLAGSKRLMDSFRVDSMPGAGTTVTAVKYLHTRVAIGRPGREEAQPGR